ncbi:single-stranded-DNA-specific exonuclease RecJ [Vagococcus zengguangii]|uniref:single-stranded-DNA-specific exonuclease RecJ n=1 Tax=Vagococcus zengguangii TaxID=2571750 RepID=UPI0011090CE2|nr:single-stranded-DNA-specific exonuclease RecJ [Vagococcus zengguangii]TLG81354.1 single-stranded-DNA-specific exonuclease RecJ [Vagococcus zengguangii]
MKQSKYHWIRSEEPIQTELINWLKEHGFSEQLAPLLANRKITTAEQLSAYFYPNLEDLYDPFLLFDMDKAVNRLFEAIESGQKIVIYGDYDADGITSTTVMKEAIELVGGDVSYFLPNRFEHGYGPNVKVYEQLIADGAELIVTVDNGVTGHEAIEYAKTQGVDVIVTDHHELPPELPEPYALIHPKHPAGNYPFGDLAGVGVAFKVATALLEEPPVELLDLVAIGTIADLVSLTDENRNLVKHGLQMMKETDRVGLNALMKVANVDKENISAESVGFGIGPRLNAIGRIGDASPGVELMCTFDEEQAEELATFIQKKNEERQAIVATISQEALEMVAELGEQSIYLLAKEGWNEGVLGIVASQIVQKTNRPAIILSLNPESGLAKGSGRSIEQINLYDLLSEIRDELVKFGGHHMAAGMTLEQSKLPEIQAKLNTLIEQQSIDFSVGQPLNVEDHSAIEALDVRLVEAIQTLGPFGTDNPSPVFLFENGRAQMTKAIGADQKHLKFQFQTSDASIDVIAFGYGNQLVEIDSASELAIVGDLSINEWNGNKKVQLMMKDYGINEKQVFDYREKLHLLPELLSLPRTFYVLFDGKHLNQFKAIPQEHLLLVGDQTDLSQYAGAAQSVVFLDCPIEEHQLQEIVSELQVERIYLLLYSKEQCYLNGMPSREAFGKLFKLVQTKQEIDVRYKLNELAQYINVEFNTIIFMINVLFELKFVTIENGVMRKVDSTNFTPLNESKVYQTRERKMQTEKFLLYSNIIELEKWLFQ